MSPQASRRDVVEYVPITGLACGLELTEEGLRVVTRKRQPANILPGFTERLEAEQLWLERQRGFNRPFDALGRNES